MIPPVLAAVFLGTPYFDILVVASAVVLVGEIFFATARSPAWTLGGAVYVGLAGYALVALRADVASGLPTLVWLMVLVWSADTGAYVVGRTFGGPKFAPRLSPNKTWSGFAGAVVFAGLAGLLVGLWQAKDSLAPLVLVSAALGAVSQLGDLLESWLKRRFDKKDMSTLIPGHGGLADRADGLVAAAIAAWCIDLAAPEAILAWL